MPGSTRKAWLFVAFPLAVIGIFTALPTLAGLGLSLFEWDGGGRPRFVALENFRALALEDRQFRYALQTVPGVAEVASVGGQVRQYQVEVDPNQMAAYGLSLAQVRRAIERSNIDVGGRLVEQAETEFMVRGRGYVRSVADLAGIAIGADPSGTPILLSSVATVQLGPELRRGLTDLDGEGDVVREMSWGRDDLAGDEVCVERRTAASDETWVRSAVWLERVTDAEITMRKGVVFSHPVFKST